MRFFLLVSFVLLMGGCSIKEYTQTKSKLLTLKTKKLRFSDLAYLRNSGDALEVELFVAGHVFKRLTLNHLICISDEGCITKSRFNKEFLSTAYPNDLLGEVFLGKPIYNGKNLQKTSYGFMQTIDDEAVKILYKVSQQQIYFKDKKNHILIKIKELK